jgi:hypothetical protein
MSDTNSTHDQIPTLQNQDEDASFRRRWRMRTIGGGLTLPLLASSTASAQEDGSVTFRDGVPVTRVDASPEDGFNYP